MYAYFIPKIWYIIETIHIYQNTYPTFFEENKNSLLRYSVKIVWIQENVIVVIKYIKNNINSLFDVPFKCVSLCTFGFSSGKNKYTKIKLIIRIKADINHICFSSNELIKDPKIGQRVNHKPILAQTYHIFIIFSFSFEISLI